MNNSTIMNNRFRILVVAMLFALVSIVAVGCGDGGGSDGGGDFNPGGSVTPPTTSPYATKEEINGQLVDYTQRRNLGAIAPHCVESNTTLVYSVSEVIDCFYELNLLANVNSRVEVNTNKFGPYNTKKEVFEADRDIDGNPINVTPVIVNAVPYSWSGGVMLVDNANDVVTLKTYKQIAATFVYNYTWLNTQTAQGYAVIDATFSGHTSNNVESWNIEKPNLPSGDYIIPVTLIKDGDVYNGGFQYNKKYGTTLAVDINDQGTQSPLIGSSYSYSSVNSIGTVGIITIR